MLEIQGEGFRVSGGALAGSEDNNLLVNERVGHRVRHGRNSSLTEAAGSKS